MRLEDQTSGELFAMCPLPMDGPSASAVDPVVDSSRYFVLRVVDRSGPKEQHAWLGLGFRERGAASDFRMAIADYVSMRDRNNRAEVRPGLGSRG